MDQNNNDFLNKKLSEFEIESKHLEFLPIIKDYIDTCGGFYASIIHDKDNNDNGDNVHFHCMCKLPKRVLVKSIISHTGVPVQNIQKIKASFQASLQYLTHKNNKDKAQYDPFDVETNDTALYFNNYEVELKIKTYDTKDEDNEFYLSGLISSIYCGDLLTKEAVILKLMTDRRGSLYSKNYKLIDDTLKIVNTRSDNNDN